MLVVLMAPPPAWGHVGSPDIYVEGDAGPYHLFVTIRPPQVIPGVAEVQVRTSGGQADEIDIAPIPMMGEAAKHPPVADAMQRSAGDTSFYTGALWLMQSGSEQIRFTAKGASGQGVFSVPVPAMASSTLGMRAGLGIVLALLGLLLVAGVIGIVGAAVRDAQLPAGRGPSMELRRRAAVAMAVSLALMVGAVWFGERWWKAEAQDYGNYVYKPLRMVPALEKGGDGGPRLTLKIVDPGWLKSRRVDDLVIDHDHLMHLYLLRLPGLDRVYHLHPEQVEPGAFELVLPSIEAGRYAIYADVVHETGFPETLVSSIEMPAIGGRKLAGDDAAGEAAAVPAGLSSGSASCEPTSAGAARQRLPDGYEMRWENGGGLTAKSPRSFEFALYDGEGKPASDVRLYMGMLGHAAFVKDDGRVFAHVHPSGTASMTALMKASAQNGKPGMAPGMVMGAVPSPAEQNDSLPNRVSFPYGFPSSGGYRIFVQIKHGERIETGVFDACVAPEPAR